MNTSVKYYKYVHFIVYHIAKTSGPQGGLIMIMKTQVLQLCKSQIHYL